MDGGVVFRLIPSCSVDSVSSYVSSEGPYPRGRQDFGVGSTSGESSSGFDDVTRVHVVVPHTFDHNVEQRILTTRLVDRKVSCQPSDRGVLRNLKSHLSIAPFSVENCDRNRLAIGNPNRTPNPKDRGVSLQLHIQIVRQEILQLPGR